MALTGQAEAPPKGSVVGASDRALCEGCPRTKSEKKVKRFYRPWEIIADPDVCLLDQGILNMIEMAFRAFDPCYSCATHSLPGQLPMQVRVHRGGTVTHTFRRNC